MRVSRQQAAENRKRVIETAGRLFRENGFDGIGLKDLMAGAGLTQGGFYKQFASKDELVALATHQALASAAERWSAAIAAQPGDALSAVTDLYLSEGHSSERADGCPIVALGSDAARQGPEVKAAFEAGIRAQLDMISGWLGEREADAMAVLATMVGAVLLSRIVNDETLSRRFLEAASASISGQAGPIAGQPERMR